MSYNEEQVLRIEKDLESANKGLDEITPLSVREMGELHIISKTVYLAAFDHMFKGLK